MTRPAPRTWRRWADALLHIDDTPPRTAAAFALGVFLGFSPFLGLHTVLGLLLAFVLDLNRVAVMLGVYSNLPWIIAAYYALATAAGALLLGADVPTGFGERLGELFQLSPFDGAFWLQLVELLQPLAWPFLIGSTLGAGMLASFAYVMSLKLLRARQTIW
jgi:uncharacterized protein